ncbi:MAG: DUF3089 domain-containing protein [Lysobacterales bacterium]
MNKLTRISGALIVALLGVFVVFISMDWRLWQRYLLQPDDIADPANALWFSPKETLAEGSGVALVVADEEDRTLTKSALDAAWQYAQSQGTDALIVAHNGIVQFERYAQGIDQSTLFQSQSLHKGLTAMALGAAIHRGDILSADVPAATFLTEWLDGTESQRATLADLAYMQSGIQHPRYANHPFSRGLQLFLSGNVSDKALSTPFVAEPGKYFIWSNASTLSLSIAIERAVGQPWSAFIAESLWKPLGNGEAYVQVDKPGGTAFSSCCLVSNARNWLRVGQLLLDDGVVNGKRLLAEGWVEKMTTGSKTNPNYGMQLWLNEPYSDTLLRRGLPRLELPRTERLLATDAFYIEGHFSQRIHVVPSSGLVVVRLGDDVRQWNDAKLMNGLITSAQSHQANRPLPPPPPPKAGFDEEAKAAIPNYEDANYWAKYSAGSGGGANGFYVYPTTYRGPAWNVSALDRKANLEVDAVISGQSSVLDLCCALYAPYYRQASSAAVFDRTGSGPKAYALAFEDVKAAFLEFLRVTDEAPFVLMGHSQGAFHIQRLLSEVVMPRGLSDRLVVAYIVGVSLPVDMINNDWSPLTLCNSADQTGCIMNWATFGPDASAQMYQNLIAQRFPKYARADGTIDIACSNPLSGSSEPADASANLGARPVPVAGAYLSAPIPNLTGAGCDGGMLRLTNKLGTPFESLVFAGDNYHFYDVALFHENLRDDASRRVAAFVGR